MKEILNISTNKLSHYPNKKLNLSIFFTSSKGIVDEEFEHIISSNMIIKSVMAEGAVKKRQAGKNVFLYLKWGEWVLGWGQGS